MTIQHAIYFHVFKLTYFVQSTQTPTKTLTFKKALCSCVH